MALSSSPGLDVTMAPGGSAGHSEQYGPSCSMTSGLQNGLRWWPRRWVFTLPSVVSQVMDTNTDPYCLTWVSKWIDLLMCELTHAWCVWGACMPRHGYGDQRMTLWSWLFHHYVGWTQVPRVVGQASLSMGSFCWPVMSRGDLCELIWPFHNCSDV